MPRDPDVDVAAERAVTSLDGLDDVLDEVKAAIAEGLAMIRRRREGTSERSTDRTDVV